jgi:restriction system protein
MRLFKSLWSLLRGDPFRLRGPDYHHFREIIVPTARGTTEIDHLIVSRFGIFVIEFKDRSGWIFGSDRDAYWTTVHFTQKFTFQNPLRQNYGHMKALEEFLGVGPHKLHGLVVFRGAFEFKTPIPDGVCCHDYVSWVAEKRDVLLEETAVERIVSSLRSKAMHGWFAGLRHARSVRKRYSNDAVCPKCDGDLVMRIARTGPMPGSEFLGCANYPACKYTRNVHASSMLP